MTNDHIAAKTKALAAYAASRAEAGAAYAAHVAAIEAARAPRFGRTVREGFTHRYGHGGTVEVPAGARVTPNYFEPGCFFVSETTYPEGSIERHDASYYGIRVYADNVQEA